MLEVKRLFTFAKFQIMSYIVTKSTKSRGIAALLVFLFGGLGLFYASVLGGIVMGILVPIAIYFFLFLGVMAESTSLIAIVIIFCCLYYIICLIWALRAVSSYNRNLVAESNHPLLHNQDSNIVTINQGRKRSPLFFYLLIFLLLGTGIYILYHNGVFDNTPVKKQEQTASISIDSLNKRSISVDKKKESADNKIDKQILNLPDKYAWKITHYVDNAITGKTMNIETEEKYFVFYEKKIYLIANGFVIKTWHERKTHYEDELEITETREGDTFSIFGDVEIKYKSGLSMHYECDQVPIKDVYIDKSSLN